MFTLFLISLLLSNSIGQDYFIDTRQNCDNVFVTPADSSSEYVRYLGKFSNTNDCIQQCINNGTKKDGECQSYTYYTSQYADIPYKQHCYGRYGIPYGLLWQPVPITNANCGRVIYQCTSDIDCEFNGKCDISTGNCTCNQGWTGYHCQTLNFEKATKGTGYHITNDNNSGKPTSSWGGGVLIDKNDTNDDTKYHMFLAEFDNHCGVNSWTLNSVVTHAQSTKGYNSPYERVEVLHSHFSHEPNACYGPNGEIVIYYSSFNYTQKECECSDGSTPPSCSPPSAEFINLMDYSASGSPNGPWIRTVIFPTKETNTGDTNLAGVITPNGTFIGMMRYFLLTGSMIHLVTSTDWKNGAKYKIQNALLFPNLDILNTEDPFVYIDCNGYYHAIFHNMSPLDNISVCGGHAYSENGIDWIYGGSSYGNIVEFTDGTNFSFSRRERPHFIMADDGCTPIALTNGAQYGGQYGDATYTLLQPIKH